MNIENGSFQLNRYPTGMPVTESGQKVSADAAKPSGNALITQVAEGQMFEGKIVDVNGSQVTIQMNGDAMLQARMAEAMNMNIGDSLSFLVKENSGSTVLIQPFAQNTEAMKDNAIFKLLEQNNLTPSEKNYQIAETLLSQNMRVDRASMQRLIQQAYKYPDASIQTLATMNKMNLAVDAQSIRQFELYQTNQHQIMQEITELSDALADTVRTFGDGMSPEQTQTAFAEVLQLVSDAEDAPVLDPKSLFAGQETLSVSVAGQEAGRLMAAAPEASGTELASALAEKLHIGEADAMAVTKQLTDMGLPKEVVSAMLSQSETPAQFMNHLQQALDYAVQEKQIPAERVQVLLQSDSMKELFAGVIKEKFTIQPDKLQRPDEVTEYYKHLYEKAGRILEHFGSDAGQASGQQLSQSAKGMQERIDFMQNLNQMFAYTQLPVRLEGRDQNADLFVYMNKKRMQEKKEDISALLHLDMDYLGPTDVHVSLRGSVVHTRFYVEDEISAKIIDEHMSSLEKAIAENGFSLTNEVITREPTLHADTEKNAVIREMFEDDMEKSIKRYSFDVRM